MLIIPDISGITNADECEHCWVNSWDSAWPHTGCFTIKDGDCGLALCLPPRLAFPLLSSCFWERHPESKCFPAVIKIKDEGNYLFICLIFMGIYSQSREEENPSSTCQRACQLLLCFISFVRAFTDRQYQQRFNLVTGCDPVPLLYQAKKGQFMSFSVHLGWEQAVCRWGQKQFLLVNFQPLHTPEAFHLCGSLCWVEYWSFSLTRQQWGDGSFSHLLPAIVGEEVGWLANLMGTNFL